MLLKEIQPKINGKQSVLQFKGYNANAVIDDGEMRDMYNLSSDKYPVLSQRAPRNIIDMPVQHPRDIIVKNNVPYIVDRYEVDGEIRTFIKYSKGGTDYQKRINNIMPKTMVAHNNKICIWPDKVYLDITDNTVKHMDASVRATATIKPGSIYLVGADLSEFSVGDAIEISGCKKQPGNNTVIVIKSIEGSTITTYENSFRMPSDDVTKESYVEEEVKLERDIPDLDYVMESNNRLWGCRSEDNTIYASKLGDPLNWNYFQSLANDSYALEVGSDGEFTGCAAYPTHLIFFKEHHMHKIFGSMPSQYQLYSTECFGIRKGSDKSAVIVNGVLYYHSLTGVMAYDGGTYPVMISEAFGDYQFKSAVGGSNGKKYYISMLNESENKYNIFTYDILRRLWHKEDETKVTAFANVNNELIYIADGNIWTTTGKRPEDDIKWFAVFGPFDEFVENMKSYKKINMRLDMQPGAQLRISTQSSNGEWEPIYECETERGKTLSVPIIPNRQAKFSIKIEGVGRTDIESLTRYYRGRSDRP